MSVLMNLSVFPIAQGESLSPFVARVVERIAGLGHPYRLTAMGTQVETEGMDQALEVIAHAHQALEVDCSRVYISVTLDARRGPVGRLEGKVEAVERRMNPNPPPECAE